MVIKPFYDFDGRVDRGQIRRLQLEKVADDKVNLVSSAVQRDKPGHLFNKVIAHLLCAASRICTPSYNCHSVLPLDILDIFDDVW